MAESTWNPSKQGASRGQKEQRLFDRGPHLHGKGRQSKEMDDVTISKTLSSILRHNAGNYGLTLMKGGYLYVDDLLAKVHKLKDVKVEDIKRVVDTNDKKRFTLEEESGRLKIRANQGHSLEVDSLELKPILSAKDFPVVVHGTYHADWEKIQKTGLSKMGRNHIHFAVGEPGEEGVISGMRKTCDVKIYLNLEKALKDGLQFFQSANNVILSPGDKDGIIPPFYFDGAVDRIKNHKLTFDDKIGAPTTSEPGADDGGEKKKRKKNKKKSKHEEMDERTSKGGKFDENEDIKAEVKAAAASRQLSASDSSTLDWDSEVKTISTSEDSCNIINNMQSNHPPFVVICSAGQNLGEINSCISYLVILCRPKIFVYHLTSETKGIMAEGNLDQLFLNKDIHKVFFNIGATTLSLANEFDILVDGTPVWDIQLVFHKVQLKELELEEMQERHGISKLKTVFKTWAKEDDDITKKMARSTLDRTIVDALVSRGKLIWDLYDHCHRKLTDTLRKPLKTEIFKAALTTDDEKLAEKINQLKLQRREKNKANKSKSKSK